MSGEEGRGGEKKEGDKKAVGFCCQWGGKFFFFFLFPFFSRFYFVCVCVHPGFAKRSAALAHFGIFGQR